MREKRERKEQRLDNPLNPTDQKAKRSNDIDMKAIKAKASSKNTNSTNCNLILTHLSD
jgi:hypothetical protein